jgi:hypothetical protein
MASFFLSYSERTTRRPIPTRPVMADSIRAKVGSVRIRQAARHVKTNVYNSLIL